MPYPTVDMKESAAIGSVNGATHAALYTTAGGATAGTEVVGGTYARLPITWQNGAVDGSVTSGNLVFNVPAGTTVRGFGLHTALTGGSFKGGGELADEVFNTDNTYTLVVNSVQN